MKPLALAVLLALPASAEPSKGNCNPWAGSAQVWTHYDEQSGTIKPQTLRQCGGAPRGALAYAKRCMAQFGNKLASRRHVVIGDFSTSQDFVRLWVLEWDQNDPENSIPLLRGGLAHGAGNGQDVRTGVPEIALDMNDSAATPGGCMRIFGTGNPGTMRTAGQTLKAYKLDGLEVQNACAWQRGLHFHEGYRQNGVDKVMTRRIENVGPKDTGAGDFGRVEMGSNLGTAATPGCVTLSSPDFDSIQASGIVPPPGGDWKTGTQPREKEGILFVSWFWGDTDGPPIASRFQAAPRACLSKTTGIVSDAIPREDGYRKALQERQARSARTIEDLLGAAPAGPAQTPSGGSAPTPSNR
ncbi:MAG: hypothetical protein M0D55_15890 [Elusimicrobiota bacterium]|nr:MAG: hypothetical protein M0D55_15890 [Elusimicrobiota bacterium]